MAAAKRMTGKEDLNDQTEVKSTGLSDKTGCRGQGLKSDSEFCSVGKTN